MLFLGLGLVAVLLAVVHGRVCVFKRLWLGMRLVVLGRGLGVVGSSILFLGLMLFELAVRLGLLILLGYLRMRLWTVFSVLWLPITVMLAIVLWVPLIVMLVIVLLVYFRLGLGLIIFLFLAVFLWLRMFRLICRLWVSRAIFRLLWLRVGLVFAVFLLMVIFLFGVFRLTGGLGLFLIVLAVIMFRDLRGLWCWRRLGLLVIMLRDAGMLRRWRRFRLLLAVLAAIFFLGVLWCRCRLGLLILAVFLVLRFLILSIFHGSGYVSHLGLRRDADLAMVVLVALFAALVVLLDGLHIVATNGNGLRSRCESKNSNDCRLGQPHDGGWVGI
jgi:hypothetical protein